LHLSAHQFETTVLTAVINISHYHYSKTKQQKNKWVIFLNYHFLQHKSELRTIMQSSYNQQFPDHSLKQFISFLGGKKKRGQK
jgi:hypothetical protein